MKTTLRHCAAAAVGAAAVLAFTSCVYDPYYSPYGNSYGSAYGYGYGYGGSHFSTSFFVSTGDVRWGYDPYCYSYYDYQRHAYYDPYLFGYYPVGYRPQVVIGAPHPYGWRPGQGYCPPPRHVNQVTVSNYHNRESAYRSSNYDWAKQVRQQPVTQNRVSSQSSNSNPYNRSKNDHRPTGASDGHQSQGWNPFSQNTQSSSRQSHGSQYQPSSNKHVPDASSQASHTSQRSSDTQHPSSQSPQGATGPFRHSTGAPTPQVAAGPFRRSTAAPAPQAPSGRPQAPSGRPAAPSGRPAASAPPAEAPANPPPSDKGDQKSRPSKDDQGSAPYNGPFRR